jgi:hypothetical protein
LPQSLTRTSLAVKIFQGIIEVHAVSLQKTVELVAAQAEQLSCLMIGQAMGPATLSHQSLQCCAGQIRTRTELARYLVGQLESDLHGNSVYYPITGLARLRPSAFTQLKKYFTLHGNDLVRRRPNPALVRRAQ